MVMAARKLARSRHESHCHPLHSKGLGRLAWRAAAALERGSCTDAEKVKLVLSDVEGWILDVLNVWRYRDLIGDVKAVVNLHRLLIDKHLVGDGLSPAQAHA
jgi:hypothetical protein